jgi:hypothetical protein
VDLAWRGSCDVSPHYKVSTFVIKKARQATGHSAVTETDVWDIGIDHTGYSRHGPQIYNSIPPFMNKIGQAVSLIFILTKLTKAF